MKLGRSEDWFWLKVDKTFGLGPDGTCWEWRGRLFPNGYGRYWVRGRDLLAHRLAYALAHNISWDYISSFAWLICHTCHNRKCVRSDHLYAGTHKENTKDAIVSGRLSLIGEKNPRSKLTWKSIYDIRKSNNTCKELGIKFGVSYSTISLIRRQKIWKE